MASSDLLSRARDNLERDMQALAGSPPSVDKKEELRNDLKHFLASQKMKSREKSAKSMDVVDQREAHSSALCLPGLGDNPTPKSGRRNLDRSLSPERLPPPKIASYVREKDIYERQKSAPSSNRNDRFDQDRQSPPPETYRPRSERSSRPRVHFDDNNDYTSGRNNSYSRPHHPPSQYDPIGDEIAAELTRLERLLLERRKRRQEGISEIATDFGRSYGRDYEGERDHGRPFERSSRALDNFSSAIHDSGRSHAPVQPRRYYQDDYTEERLRNDVDRDRDRTEKYSRTRDDQYRGNVNATSTDKRNDRDSDPSNGWHNNRKDVIAQTESKSTYASELRKQIREKERQKEIERAEMRSPTGKLPGAASMNFGEPTKGRPSVKGTQSGQQSENGRFTRPKANWDDPNHYSSEGRQRNGTNVNQESWNMNTAQPQPQVPTAQMAGVPIAYPGIPQHAIYPGAIPAFTGPYGAHAPPGYGNIAPPLQPVGTFGYPAAIDPMMYRNQEVPMVYPSNGAMPPRLDATQSQHAPSMPNVPSQTGQMTYAQQLQAQIDERRIAQSQQPKSTSHADRASEPKGGPAGGSPGKDNNFVHIRTTGDNAGLLDQKSRDNAAVQKNMSYQDLLKQQVEEKKKRIAAEKEKERIEEEKEAKRIEAERVRLAQAFEEEKRKQQEKEAKIKTENEERMRLAEEKRKFAARQSPPKASPQKAPSPVKAETSTPPYVAPAPITRVPSPPIPTMRGGRSMNAEDDPFNQQRTTQPRPSSPPVPSLANKDKVEEVERVASTPVPSVAPISEERVTQESEMHRAENTNVAEDTNIAKVEPVEKAKAEPTGRNSQSTTRPPSSRHRARPPSSRSRPTSAVNHRPLSTRPQSRTRRGSRGMPPPPRREKSIELRDIDDIKIEESLPPSSPVTKNLDVDVHVDQDAKSELMGQLQHLRKKLEGEQRKITQDITLNKEQYSKLAQQSRRRKEASTRQDELDTVIANANVKLDSRTDPQGHAAIKSPIPQAKVGSATTELNQSMDENAIRTFSKLKYSSLATKNSSTKSKKLLLAAYPQPPLNNQDLDEQQQAMLDVQTKELARLRTKRRANLVREPTIQSFNSFGSFDVSEITAKNEARLARLNADTSQSLQMTSGDPDQVLDMFLSQNVDSGNFELDSDTAFRELTKISNTHLRPSLSK